jgi:hypothetical protein
MLLQDFWQITQLHGYMKSCFYKMAHEIMLLQDGPDWSLRHFKIEIKPEIPCWDTKSLKGGAKM